MPGFLCNFLEAFERNLQKFIILLSLLNTISLELEHHGIKLQASDTILHDCKGFFRSLWDGKRFLDEIKEDNEEMFH